MYFFFCQNSASASKHVYQSGPIYGMKSHCSNYYYCACLYSPFSKRRQIHAALKKNKNSHFIFNPFRDILSCYQVTGMITRHERVHVIEFLSTHNISRLFSIFFPAYATLCELSNPCALNRNFQHIAPSPSDYTL